MQLTGENFNTILGENFRYGWMVKVNLSPANTYSQGFTTAEEALALAKRSMADGALMAIVSRIEFVLERTGPSF